MNRTVWDRDGYSAQVWAPHVGGVCLNVFHPERTLSLSAGQARKLAKNLLDAAAEAKPNAVKKRRA